MVSRRSRYSVHPPASAAHRTAAASRKPQSVRDDTGASLAKVEDMAARRHDEPTRRRLGDRGFLPADQKEVGVACRQGVVEGRAELLAGARGLDEPWRHDDGEVRLLALEGSGAEQR